MTHCQKYVALLLLSTAISVAAANAYASEDAKDSYADNLFGNWGGVRSTLADKGVDVTVEYKGDLRRYQARQ